MKSIREFFARIKSRQFQEIQLHNSVCEVVAKHTKIILQLDAVGFAPKTLILKGLNQSAKSTVFVKKNAIIKDIQEILPARMISDIRIN